MNNSEKRRLTRWPINWQAKLKLKDKKTSKVFDPCYVNDLNFKGIQISLKETLPKTTPLSLNVILSEEFILDVKARIIWHRVVTGGVNVYGLYFTQLRDVDKEKIYKFIYANFSAELIKKWWQDIL